MTARFVPTHRTSLRKSFTASLLIMFAVGAGGTLGVIALVSCASQAKQPVKTYPKIDGPTMADTKPADLPGIHNVVAYHDNYWSGSMPEGEKGFDTLAGMGVKTIISVDGGAPDVEAAKARGIRYIHLPIGYNGFDEDRKLELTRATRDALKQGPVYIHCHHGKHRSAGAAGTAVVGLGMASPEAMIARMKVSGTAAGYKGLYACVNSASVLSLAMVDAANPNFPERALPAGFLKSMVEIDEFTEQLKEVEKAGWTVPADHPDLVPAAVAGNLSNLLRHASTTTKARTKPAEFAELLVKNSDQAAMLEDMIAAGEKDTKKLSDQFQLVAATCKDCHTKFRDEPPLPEGGGRGVGLRLPLAQSPPNSPSLTQPEPSFHIPLAPS